MTGKPAAEQQATPEPKRSAFFRNVAAGLSAGFAFAFLFAPAFPPFGLAPLTLIAATPLMVLAMSARRPAAACLGVALGAAPMWALHHVWVWEVTAAGFLPMILVLGALLSVFVWLAAAMLRSIDRLSSPGFVRSAGYIAALPIAWTAAEWFRGEVAFEGYPWFLLGHPMIDVPVVGVALPPSVGQYGVSLLCATAAALLAVGFVGHAGGPPLARRTRHVLLAAPGAAVLITTAGLLGVRTPPSTPDTQNVLRVGVVQTNLPQDNKMNWSPEQREQDFVRFIQLTRTLTETTGETPHLIVWPETMFPGLALDRDALGELTRRETAAGLDTFSTYDTMFAGFLLQEQAQRGIPMLVGALGWEDLTVAQDGTLGFRSQYNSAFLLDRGRVEHRYDKVHLTPFGEVMPYISTSDTLERALLSIGAHGMTFTLTAGTQRTPIDVPTASDDETLGVATPICFEIANARLVRDLVFVDGKRTARVIVQLTNDGWFGAWRGGKEHHLLIARWRAAELRTPLVRAANTGISAHIDARGRVVDALENSVAQTMLASVAPATDPPMLTAIVPNIAGTAAAGIAVLTLAAGLAARLLGGPIQAASEDDRGTTAGEHA